jgi:hypothetical protein
VTDSPDIDERRRDWQSRHAAYLVDTKHSRCPCCCYRTRGTPGDYCICDVCFWEDDAQDEADADEVWGGPNGDASLTNARDNFIRFGASLPRRVSLVRPPKPEEL